MTKSDPQGNEPAPEAGRKQRLQRWLSPKNVNFVSSDAQRLYRERVTRFINVINLETPDRVPVVLPSAYFPAYYAGMDLRTVMYDYDKMRQAWLKFMQDFEMDSFSGPGYMVPGKVYEHLGSRMVKWPGYGLPDDVSSHQFVEGEYMKADEYDIFMQGQLEYFLRYFLPRSWDVFEPFARIGKFSSGYDSMFRILEAAADPEFIASCRTLAEGAQEFIKWRKAVGGIDRTILEAGFAPFRGPVCSAPFDVFADTMRGTKGIMMDMYRQPDKLLEAVERITPHLLNNIIEAADHFPSPIIFMPLHKGDDAFMSEEQYLRFYWPSLKQLVLGFIDAGLVPLMFAEGKYNNRLEIIQELPRGSVVWYFDQTDMARAKKILGGKACIMGNVPASLLVTGKPQEVKEHCRRLIEVCGPGGGYILTGGAGINTGNPDNLHAMMQAALEYGWYPLHQPHAPDTV